VARVPLRPRATSFVLALVLTTASRANADPSIDDLEAELQAERRAREDLEARVARQEENERQRVEIEKQKPLSIEISGFVHVDWTLFRQSSQDEVTQDRQPLNEERFTLRRARIRAERDLGYFHGILEIDANTLNGLQVRPFDAEATFKWPAARPYARAPWAYDTTGGGRHGEPIPSPDEAWFMVSAGMFRTPFGFEVPEPERDRPWLERSTIANALFPQSVDLGLRVVGGYRFLRWSLGIMNGDPIGEAEFPGRDPNKSKDLMFRVGAATKIGHAIEVSGGVSGLTGLGFDEGEPATKDVVAWHDINDNGQIDSLDEIDFTGGSSGRPSQDFKRSAVGADLRVDVAVPVLGDLHLRGEIIRATNLDRGLTFADPVVQTRDLRETGWYVGAAQEVTSWALVGVRYDRYDPDADARQQEPFAVVPRDLSQSTWALSLTGRWGLAHLMAEYDKRTNALGRDASGRPTTLADDSFTLRAEIRF
jgi:hypothetical protein